MCFLAPVGQPQAILANLAAECKPLFAALDSRTPVRYRIEHMYAAGMSISRPRSSRSARGRLRGLGRWLLAALVVAAASVVLARAAAGGLAPVDRMVVQPGDTLWSIAAVLDPHGDERPLVDRLAQELGGSTLYPGETIAIPETR